MSTFFYQLHDAVDSFEMMAAGREPNRTLIITGALGLNGLCERRMASAVLLEAAATLTDLATGGAFTLDGANRLRYAKFAETVRDHVGALESVAAIDRQSRRTANC